MREEATPPKSMQGELISRVKIAADLDVSEKRLPQDGRFMTTVDEAYLLADSKFQDRIVSSLFSAILYYDTVRAMEIRK